MKKCKKTTNTNDLHGVIQLVRLNPELQRDFRDIDKKNMIYILS